MARAERIDPYLSEDELVKLLVEAQHEVAGLVAAAVHAVLEHLADEHRVRLVADFEDVLERDGAKAGEGRLQVVERLAHVALGGEDERLEALHVV